MSDRDKKAVGDKTTESATMDVDLRKFLEDYQALAEVPRKRILRILSADLPMEEAINLASEEVVVRREALVTRAEQAEPSELDPDEIEARMLLESFDGRITEIEQRIDRVLARLDAG